MTKRVQELVKGDVVKFWNGFVTVNHISITAPTRFPADKLVMVHGGPGVGPQEVPYNTVVETRMTKERQEFMAAAQSIGPFDNMLEGHPIWDCEGALIGVAEAMPQNDEEFDALVASAEILD